MELTGTIIQIGSTQTFGDNGFRKREIVVQTDEQYPQPILIEFVQDKCNILDQYETGQNVTVGINLRGREWINSNGDVKYFNSIQGWKINRNGQASQAASEINEMHVDDPTTVTEGGDDLPF